MTTSSCRYSVSIEPLVYKYVVAFENVFGYFTEYVANTTALFTLQNSHNNQHIVYYIIQNIIDEIEPKTVLWCNGKHNHIDMGKLLVKNT